jgi:hypothetical protein
VNNHKPRSRATSTRAQNRTQLKHFSPKSIVTLQLNSRPIDKIIQSITRALARGDTILILRRKRDRKHS